MAFAVDTLTALVGPVQTHPTDAIPFAINARSDDISGCEELKAAPTSGSIVLTQLGISSAGAITITIGEGETGGAVTTAIMGPITFAANQYMQWTFTHPIKLTAATSLTCDASGAAVVNIFVEGYNI